MVQLFCGVRTQLGRKGRAGGIRENKPHPVPRADTHTAGHGPNPCSRDWQLWKHAGNGPGAAEGLGQGQEWLWLLERHRGGNGTAQPQPGPLHGQSSLGTTKAQQWISPFPFIKIAFLFRRDVKSENGRNPFHIPHRFPGIFTAAGLSISPECRMRSLLTPDTCSDRVFLANQPPKPAL